MLLRKSIFLLKPCGNRSLKNVKNVSSKEAKAPVWSVWPATARGLDAKVGAHATLVFVQSMVKANAGICVCGDSDSASRSGIRSSQARFPAAGRRISAAGEEKRFNVAAAT